MKTNYIEHGLLKTCLKTIETFFFHASFQQSMAERYETETTMTCSEHVFSSCVTKLRRRGMAFRQIRTQSGPDPL